MGLRPHSQSLKVSSILLGQIISRSFEITGPEQCQKPAHLDLQDDQLIHSALDLGRRDTVELWISAAQPIYYVVYNAHLSQLSSD